MSDDRYTARIKLIAKHINDWLVDNSDYTYYVPQVPTISVAAPEGTRFAVLVQRGKITNELDGGDDFFYDDRQYFDIFILVNGGGLGDKDKAVFMNIAVDEVFQALRSTSVGDPPFGIAGADENRVEGSSPGSINGITAEKITFSLMVHEEY